MTLSPLERPAGGQSAHACVVIVGERGVLIRGPSGAGKSTLSLAMIGCARKAGLYAALVADDRVFLSIASGRLLARGAHGFEGFIERRGEGLLEEAHEARAVVRLVIDLFERDGAPPRWPDDGECQVELLGLTLPRLALDRGPGPHEGAYAALRRLARIP